MLQLVRAWQQTSSKGTEKRDAVVFSHENKRNNTKKKKSQQLYERRPYLRTATIPDAIITAVRDTMRVLLLRLPSDKVQHDLQRSSLVNPFTHVGQITTY